MKSGFILVAVLALIVGGGVVALVVYAGQMEAPNQAIEHVVPNESFPE